MKTRKYTPAKLSTQGHSSGNYGRILMYGSVANAEYEVRNNADRDARREQNRAKRLAERDRQKSEKHLPWDAIRDILDENPRMSLETAKQIAIGEGRW